MSWHVWEIRGMKDKELLGGDGRCSVRLPTDQPDRKRLIAQSIWNQHICIINLNFLAGFIFHPLFELSLSVPQWLRQSGFMHTSWFQKLWFLLFFCQYLTAEPDNPKSEVIYLIPEKVFRNPSSAVMRWQIRLRALPGIFLGFTFSWFLPVYHLCSVTHKKTAEWRSRMEKMTAKKYRISTKSAPGVICSAPQGLLQLPQPGEIEEQLILSLCPETIIPPTWPHCFAPGDKQTQPEGIWETRAQPWPNNQEILLLHPLA